MVRISSAGLPVFSISASTTSDSRCDSDSVNRTRACWRSAGVVLLQPSNALAADA
jgi:hypothetical protein